jgi:hypothetical protein
MNIKQDNEEALTHFAFEQGDLSTNSKKKLPPKSYAEEIFPKPAVVSEGESEQ